MQGMCKGVTEEGATTHVETSKEYQRDQYNLFYRSPRTNFEQATDMFGITHGAVPHRNNVVFPSEAPEAPGSHWRVLEAGAMINELCLVQVHDKCLESVYCFGDCETYAINAEDFVKIFVRQQDTFQEMTEKCVRVGARTRNI